MLYKSITMTRMNQYTAGVYLLKVMHPENGPVYVAGSLIGTN